MKLNMVIVHRHLSVRTSVGHEANNWACDRRYELAAHIGRKLIQHLPTFPTTCHLSSISSTFNICLSRSTYILQSATWKPILLHEIQHTRTPALATCICCQERRSPNSFRPHVNTRQSVHTQPSTSIESPRLLFPASYPSIPFHHHRHHSQWHSASSPTRSSSHSSPRPSSPAYAAPPV